MKAKQYYELAGLQEVYLEDSFVLAIAETANSVEFRLDVVLRENHPNYRLPLPGEQYCYLNCILRFPNATQIVWSGIEDRQIFRDAAGEIDCGNIDEFIVQNGKFRLSGDWGRLELISQDPELMFLEK